MSLRIGHTGLADNQEYSGAVYPARQQVTGLGSGDFNHHRRFGARYGSRLEAFGKSGRKGESGVCLPNVTAKIILGMPSNIA